jgi:hypothetical protein
MIRVLVGRLRYHVRQVPLAQLFVRFAVWGVPCRERHRLARARVASDPARSSMHGEPTEAADLDALPRRQRVGHVLEHELECIVQVLAAERVLAFGQDGDQFGFRDVGGCDGLPVSSSISTKTRRPCVGCQLMPPPRPQALLGDRAGSRRRLARRLQHG